MFARQREHVRHAEPNVTGAGFRGRRGWKGQRTPKDLLF